MKICLEIQRKKHAVVDKVAIIVNYIFAKQNQDVKRHIATRDTKMNFGDNDAFIREIVLNISRSMEVFLFFVACFIETLTQMEKKTKKKS